MARDLLSAHPPPHLFRHDLESLFYVLLWQTHSYEAGSFAKNLPFEYWDNFTYIIVDKATWLPTPTPQHAPLQGLISDLKRTIAAGQHARDEHLGVELRHRRHGTGEGSSDNSSSQLTPFDNETLDGHVSFKAVKEIFDNNRLL